MRIGTVMWKFECKSCFPVDLSALVYHMENADIRLISLQSYSQQHGGQFEMDALFT